MNTVKVNGIEYHADDEGNPLVDEDGDFIESYICLCAAHSSSECCCGAWDRPYPNQDWDFKE